MRARAVHRTKTNLPSNARARHGGNGGEAHENLPFDVGLSLVERSPRTKSNGRCESACFRLADERHSPSFAAPSYYLLLRNYIYPELNSDCKRQTSTQIAHLVYVTQLLGDACGTFTGAQPNARIKELKAPTQLFLGAGTEIQNGRFVFPYEQNKKQAKFEVFLKFCKISCHSGRFFQFQARKRPK